jgi:hypothetical protein
MLYLKVFFTKMFHVGTADTTFSDPSRTVTPAPKDVSVTPVPTDVMVTPVPIDVTVTSIPTDVTVGPAAPTYVPVTIDVTVTPVPTDVTVTPAVPTDMSVTPVPKDVRCKPCTCVNNSKYFTTESIEQSLHEIKQRLLLPQKNLSSYIRRLRSAGDSRRSAADIGYVGAAVIVCCVGWIVSTDVTHVASIMWTRITTRFR